MIITDQESLDGMSRENSIAEHRPASNGALLHDTSIKEDWCDGEDPEADISPHGPSSYPLTLERSTSEFGGDGEGEGYEGVAGTACSDEFSDVGEPGDTEVVFVKEGVNVWPSRSERIMGRLSLIKQHGVLFLAWLPYTPGSLLEDGSFHAAAAEVAHSMQSAKERTLYAVHPIPLSDIKAIQRHTPPLGAHKIVVTLFNGVSLAPLYFQQGGIKAFFSSLREHGHLMRSAHDPNTYLVNDTADPLQRSLTSMELTDVILGAPPARASGTFPPADGRYAEEGWRDAELEVPLVSQITHLVDRFQRGITSAKATASSFFASSFMLPPDHMDAPASPPRQVSAGPAAGLPAGADLAASFGSTCPDPGAESAGTAGEALGAVEAAGVDRGDGLEGGEGVAQHAQHAAGQAQRGEGDLQGATTELGVFEIIERSNAGTASSSPLWTRARPPPLTREELDAFCDREGRLVDVGSFRQRVFYGGVEPEARPLVWKLLLGLYPEGASREERRRLEAAQQEEYLRLRRQWSSIGKEQAARFAKWRERKARIEKDVRRTDRGVRLFSKEGGQGQQLLRRLLLSYSLYNFDLGYCQGMSDMAAPILYVMRGQVCGTALTPQEELRVESQAFWCFARLMDRMEPNFSSDCTGMHAQLVALRRLVQLLDPPLYAHLEATDCLNFYFCYRWCLIHFKRELPFEEVLRLWEALWTGHPDPQLHLYICVALLEHHRREIMGEGLDFDGLLKFCVDLSGRLDLAALLRDSEVLCKYAGEAGRECVAGLPVLPCMAGEAV